MGQKLTLCRNYPWVDIILPMLAMTLVSRVEEGHVGVYFRGGAMLQGMAGPGLSS